MKSIAIAIMIVACFSSCNKSNKSDRDSEEKQGIVQDTLVVTADSITKITCFNDPEITYHIYLPSGTKDGKSHPLIIFLDPHARGKLPLTKYRHLADSFGYVLVLLGCHPKWTGCK
ncbi:MAG: hypothetical protein MZU84_07500 [Sphingobacterium sp.]|nr:hypothetical protein [Sphingobacterium sp.]